MGFVLLSTIPSEMLTPSFNDLIEMREDDLPDFAPQGRREVVLMFLDDIETLRLKPILA